MSSAQQQAASSALRDSTLAGFIQEKDMIKGEIGLIKNEINGLVSSVYAPGGGVTMDKIAQLNNSIAALIGMQNDIQASANKIFSLQTLYQDPTLQSLAPDPNLTSLGLKRVFDRLRNKYIVLDTSGKIVPNPVTPMRRSYTTFVLRGGKRVPKKSRKIQNDSGF